MTKIARPSTAMLGTILAFLLHAAPAQATLTRTWVSSTGNPAPATPCSRTQPCATFDQAHTATTPGGEINCIDAGDYGGMVITKSISVICDNTEAGIIVTGGGVGVSINAGPNDIITLKGLNIEGTGNGIVGINFFTAAALHVHKVQIRHFGISGFNGTSGIFFSPTGYSELYVSDSYITDNAGTLSFTGGIVIRPSGSGSANVFINRVKLENNAAGIVADGTNSTGVAINAMVVDSVVSGSAGHGISANTSAGHPAISIVVDGTRIAGNFGSGIRATATSVSATIRIGGSSIVNNVTGASATGTGVLQSFKNNRISGNLADGTPITAFPGPGGTPLQ